MTFFRFRNYTHFGQPTGIEDTSKMSSLETLEVSHGEIEP